MLRGMKWIRMQGENWHRAKIVGGTLWREGSIVWWTVPLRVREVEEA